MKFFGGNKLAGGSASRAEVYGLFFAAIVLVGGGVGGAFAYSASGVFSQNQQPRQIPSSASSPSASNSLESSNPDLNTGKELPDEKGNNIGGNKSKIETKSEQINSVPEQQQGATIPQTPEETRIQEPYIGPANTFSYLSRNHICGWDTQALGGFGWGYDPAEPCNRQFEEYIRSNCGVKDPQTGQWSGIVYYQRCDEMESGTLPIAY